jgi:hypothetical protein
MTTDQNIIDRKNSLNKINGELLAKAAKNDLKTNNMEFSIALFSRPTARRPVATHVTVSNDDDSVFTNIAQKVGPKIGNSGEASEQFMIKFMVSDDSSVSSPVKYVPNKSIIASISNNMIGEEIVYNLTFLKNGSAFANLSDSSDATHDLAPKQVALKARQLLEGIFDRDEGMRSALMQRNFKLPDELARLLPENLRDIRDLPDGPHLGQAGRAQANKIKRVP